MRRCETVTHNITVDWVLFSFSDFFFLFFPAYVVSLPLFHCLLSLFYSSQSFSLSPPASSHQAGQPLPSGPFHTHAVVFLIALCVPLLSPPFVPLLHWWGSGAGRDDSRARFSLWVYYLCSGPFKTTPNGPGSQCGEFVLTSCLFHLSSSPPPLAPFLPPVFHIFGESVEDCCPSRDSLFPALRLLFALDLVARRHLICRLILHLLGCGLHCRIEASVRSAPCLFVVPSFSLWSVKEMNSAHLSLGDLCCLP